jgi:hypothetical protein
MAAKTARLRWSKPSSPCSDSGLAPLQQPPQPVPVGIPDGGALRIDSPADDRFGIPDEARQMVAVARRKRVAGFGEPPRESIAPAHPRNWPNEWQARRQLDDRWPGAVDTAVNVQDVDGSGALVGGQGRQPAGSATVRQGQDV